MSAPLSKRELRKLQSMIDRTVRACAAYHAAQAELNNWCGEQYGYEPGDVDADQIIDDVFGGCGVPTGMSAVEFDATMRDPLGEADNG